MRRLSKLLLLVQAPFLAYLSLLGFLLCAGTMLPDHTGVFSKEHLGGLVVGIVILSALVAGWRIWFWVMADGPQESKSIHKIWWLFAAVGVSLTLISLLSRFVSQLTALDISMPFEDLFLLGSYFIPSLLNISIETWWQRRANQSFKPTPQSGAA